MGWGRVIAGPSGEGFLPAAWAMGVVRVHASARASTAVIARREIAIFKAESFTCGREIPAHLARAIYRIVRDLWGGMFGGIRPKSSLDTCL